MDDKHYTLMVVRIDGICHTTKASGWFAESMLDREFTDVVKATRTRYAVVIDDTGSIRREWCARVVKPA